MNGTVVPFRHRDQVSRGIGTFRRVCGPPPPRRSPQVRIDSSVVLNELMRGLHAAGLSFRREAGTGVYVIGPE